MRLSRWAAAVLDSLGLRGIRHQPLPAAAEEATARRLAQIEDEVQAAVVAALATWTSPSGEDVRVAEVHVVDQEYGDVAGRSLWIDLELAGAGAQEVPEGHFLRPAPRPAPPGPDASAAERDAYREEVEDPDRDVVPPPLGPATTSWLEDLERRTLEAAGRARPGARVHVTFVPRP